MGYSLLSRFRGIFVGVAIANSQVETVDQGDRAFSLMLASAESLIRCGGLNLSDWQKHCRKKENFPISLEYSWVALLPIALFYHEDEFRLAQQLKQVISLWPEIESRESDLMALGWAISHVIKQKTEASTTIPHIFERLESWKKNDPPVFGQNLEKINRLLGEYASLETAMVRLKINDDPDSAAIALALYCFLSTAENFQISVQRAARTQPQPHLTALLTGAFSGAYNGWAAIPITWYLSESTTAIGQSQIIQLLTVADRLFASWLGIYHMAKDLEKNSVKPEMMAIGAPNVLRHQG